MAASDAELAADVRDCLAHGCCCNGHHRHGPGAAGADVMPRLRPETILLKQRMKALQGARMLPESWDKRFVQDVCHWRQTMWMTDRQKAQIERLCWRYRRQLPVELVPAVQP